jgi:hypothetical protein
VTGQSLEEIVLEVSNAKLCLSCSSSRQSFNLQHIMLSALLGVIGFSRGLSCF